jgi:hypothetical protein
MHSPIFLILLGCVGNNIRKGENVASASPSSGSALTVAIEDIMDPNYTIDCNGMFLNNNILR